MRKTTTKSKLLVTPPGSPGQDKTVPSREGSPIFLPLGSGMDLSKNNSTNSANSSRQTTPILKADTATLNNKPPEVLWRSKTMSMPELITINYILAEGEEKLEEEKLEVAGPDYILTGAEEKLEIESVDDGVINEMNILSLGEAHHRELQYYHPAKILSLFSGENYKDHQNKEQQNVILRAELIFSPSRYRSYVSLSSSAPNSKASSKHSSYDSLQFPLELDPNVKYPKLKTV